jgi:uncharacterized protein
MDINVNLANRISAKTGLKPAAIISALKLFDEGCTIPFIARYRKELTSGLNEVQLAEIQLTNEKLQEFDKRKKAIIESIEEQGKLSPELLQRIQECELLSELEDLYLPYKPKRKTRASVARENGLEPLAILILKQETRNVSLASERFINDKVAGVEAALDGAKDIIAEIISENPTVRARIRNVFSREAILSVKRVKNSGDEGLKYKDYFEYNEPLRKCPSHRLLAVFRGEAEGHLSAKLEIQPEKWQDIISRVYIKSNGECADIIEEAATDSYKRLIAPAMETEFRNEYKEKADLEAIRVFGQNLKQLLLAPPLGEKRIMGIDPGYRTGCKVVCIDENGNLLHNETIYPHPPQNDTVQAAKKVKSLCEAYKIDAIAIGNGTAGRETEYFISKKVFFSPDSQIKVFVVNESGASIYSASSVAREEFPSYDVTVRGAVSIARRLADPLAELVKIDPKSIGVGQYQHDVDQNLLKKELDRIVENCVNNVGVNVNTASKYLLTYVSGLGPQLAQNIVDYRKQNGSFESREELKKVPRLGAKAFEQAAGFLRIKNSKNPLDASAVHPERYEVVKKMAASVGCSIPELLTDEQKRKQINITQFVDAELGLPTLNDILKELSKPGLDPRGPLKTFSFDSKINKIEDLQIGMTLPGIVTNITNFGCFVDIGVKQDGLVHLSQLADRYVRDPNEIVKLQQQVTVKVLEVDVPRKRINLSMKQNS